MMATKDNIGDMNLGAICAGMSDDTEGGKVDIHS
jgi:hypothetical protein